MVIPAFWYDAGMYSVSKKRIFFSFFLSFFFLSCLTPDTFLSSRRFHYIIPYVRGVERCNKMQIKFPDSIFVSWKFYSVKKHTFPHLLLFVYKFKRLLLNFTRKVESSFSILFFLALILNFFFLSNVKKFILNFRSFEIR